MSRWAKSVASSLFMRSFFALKLHSHQSICRVFAMIDTVFFVIIGLSALLGLFYGFTRIVVKTAAWTIAAWAAFEFGGFLALKLSDHGAPTPTQTFGGYALVFVVTWIGIGMLGAILRTGVAAADLTGMDRVLGLLLGIVRGVCVCSLLALAMSFTALTTEPQWHESRAMVLIMPLTNWMRTQLANWNLLKKTAYSSPKAATVELGHAYGRLLQQELGRVVEKISPSRSAAPAATTEAEQDSDAISTRSAPDHHKQNK